MIRRWSPAEGVARSSSAPAAAPGGEVFRAWCDNLGQVDLPVHAAAIPPQVETETGASLPGFVKDEFDAFLECGILAYGFLRLRCGDCGHEKLVAFSCKRRGFAPPAGRGAWQRRLRNLLLFPIPMRRDSLLPSVSPAFHGRQTSSHHRGGANRRPRIESESSAD